MLPMRDGVRLATDIYLPARNGQPVSEKFPAILERTPYNKDGGVPDSSGHIPASPAEYLVPRGYVVILQDVRGRYRSEGHWRAIKDDPNDGFDTAKWIGSQPWSNGKIGTIGTSYGGATQHALAIGGAPFVEAMVPIDAMSDFGHYGVRHNGAFELRFFNWISPLAMPQAPPTHSLRLLAPPCPPRAQKNCSTLAPIRPSTSETFPCVRGQHL
jgi:putative CocE/NonD family hydrolase